MGDVRHTEGHIQYEDTHAVCVMFEWQAEAVVLGWQSMAGI